jgi:hypothetical protein
VDQFIVGELDSETQIDSGVFSNRGFIGDAVDFNDHPNPKRQ